MLILTQTSCDIIREETGKALHEIASEALNSARSSKLRLLYPARARGSVRVVAGKLFTPDDAEKKRHEVSKYRLARKSTGIQRLLRHFR